MTDMNGPIRVGGATVLPGDVVLGTSSGIIFVPPQLAEQVVDDSENTRLRDYFGKMSINEGTYTPGEVDRQWSEEMDAAFAAWKETVDSATLEI
jgi:regulator of RNase E activity RraA